MYWSMQPKLMTIGRLFFKRQWTLDYPKTWGCEPIGGSVRGDVGIPYREVRVTLC